MNRKHILCFGDSNTWGYDAATGGRFDDDTRWTMQLSKRLGEKYYVIEEGLILLININTSIGPLFVV